MLKKNPDGEGQRMRVYTTDSVDRQRRVDFWSSLSSNNITPMLISADRRAPFEGRLWVDRVGPIGLARAYSSGVTIRRTGHRHRHRRRLSAALLHSIAAAYSQAYALTDAVPMTAGARRVAIKRLVEMRLGDADLTVQSIAGEFNLSDRYLRMLFAPDGESLAAYIQRRRLEEAARQLREPQSDSRTISEIAFAWGFNSLGSFDRAFRARFATTPGQYRRCWP